jgi:general secretion pathway protein A
MYAEYYNLRAMPFQLTPDCDFFYESREHSRAFSHLIYGLAQEEGFIVITGEIGAGKTMLVERLWSQLDRNRYLATRILTTRISGNDLLKMTAHGFGLPLTGATKVTLLRQLEELFIEKQAKGKRCLLIIDEAQNLPFSALEELRMLSNIAVGGRALFQGLLLGQPQFRRHLVDARLEQLQQRVLASYHLGPLSPEETRDYIRHRLTTAGWSNNPSFGDTAFAAIHRYAEGIPRKINTLCSRILLYGYLEEKQHINEAIVNEVAEELGSDLAAGLSTPRVRAAQNGDLTERLERRLESIEGAMLRHDRVLRQALEIAAELLEENRAER